jgi:hypothetical protein
MRQHRIRATLRVTSFGTLKWLAPQLVRRGDKPADTDHIAILSTLGVGLWPLDPMLVDELGAEK